MDYSDKKNELYSLTLQAIEGRISENDFVKLQNYLQENSDARQIYADLNIMYAYLRKPSLFLDIQADKREECSSFDNNLWQLLAEHEKAAPEIATLRNKTQRELIQEVVYPPKTKRKLTKFAIFTLVNTAAIILLMVFLRFAPPRGGIEVATLVDQMDVKWGQTDNIPKPGSRLWTSEVPLYLQSGIVRIQYDHGVDAVIEGPAVFEISKSGLYMEYGRVFSRVSQTGLGFTVQTPTSQFVDLGTEFGVQADVNGSSELHVIKGKVQFFAGTGRDAKTGQLITENQAVRYNANNGQVSSIAVEENTFVRQIDSKSGAIWRGQDHIDLADIIGGGNGLGTGKKSSVLTLMDTMIASGVPVNLLNYDNSANMEIRSNPFIDSLFIPKGKTHLCSKEDIVAEFPATSGATFGCVTNRGVASGAGDGWDNTLLLGGKEYGAPAAGMIHIHSNMGVTFDLNQIRQSLPGLKIVGFSSLCGITETAQQMPGYNSAVHSWVDFWVLVDGVIRFQKEHVSLTSGPIPIDVTLNANDRYLSLAVTDSDGSILFDWSIFAMPRLEVISNDVPKSE